LRRDTIMRARWSGTDAPAVRSPFHRLPVDARVGACCARRRLSTTARDGGKPLDRALSTRMGRQSAVDQPRIALLAEIRNEPGALHTLLKPFQDYRINLNRIESRPSNKGEHWFEMALDFNGDANHPNVQNFIEELKKHTANMLVLDQREVPWFPVHISELDGIANRTLDLGTDLPSDHPGAHDSEYRKRRMMLAELANSYKFGKEIPYIDYTEEEVATWGVIYNRLRGLVEQHACREYLDVVADMGQVCCFWHDIIRNNDERSITGASLYNFKQTLPTTELPNTSPVRDVAKYEDDAA